MAWLRVLAYGVLLVPLKLVAPLAVLLVDRVNHPIWGNSVRYKSYWDSANPFGNACHNLYKRPMPEYTWRGNTDDETLEALEGFQWRVCRSKDGKYVSFRCTWGAPRPSKGKRELYTGFKMRSPDFEDGLMKYSLLQFRFF